MNRSVGLGPRLVSACWALSLTLVALSCAAALAYSLGTIGHRPLDGVEGEVLYEAQRLRAGLALYTDPSVGALDAGAPPARFFVLYPPIWSWLLSFIPPREAPAAARAIACAAWFGILALVALRAPKSQRAMAMVGAAFVGGVYTLALFGSAGRPDSLALFLAGLGLLRATHGRRLDAICGALFAFAAWTKPNVFGMAAGAMIVGSFADPRAGLRACAGALGVSAAVALVLQHASGGLWVAHLLRSTLQAPSLAIWEEQALWRLQFLGLPMATAGWIAWKGRADVGTRMAFGALVSSLLWTFVSLAKIGAASNYWMEPALAALVCVAREGILPSKTDLPPGFALVAVLQALWTGVGSMRSSSEAIALARKHSELIARARTDCGATSPSDVVVADEPGLELMLNGRILSTPFQLTHLARAGRFSLASWLADFAHPNVRCLLTEDDVVERPLSDVRVEHDRFPPEVRRALVSRFAFVEKGGGWRLYRAKGPSELP